MDRELKFPVATCSYFVGKDESPSGGLRLQFDSVQNKLMVQVATSSLFGASWMPQEDYRRGAVPEPELPTKQVQ